MNEDVNNNDNIQQTDSDTSDTSDTNVVVTQSTESGPPSDIDEISIIDDKVKERLLSNDFRGFLQVATYYITHQKQEYLNEYLQKLMEENDDIRYFYNESTIDGFNVILALNIILGLV